MRRGIISIEIEGHIASRHIELPKELTFNDIGVLLLELEKAKQHLLERADEYKPVLKGSVG